MDDASKASYDMHHIWERMMISWYSPGPEALQWTTENAWNVELIELLELFEPEYSIYSEEIFRCIAFGQYNITSDALDIW